MSRSRRRRLRIAESLEDRCLLAVGPLIHTHNESQLAVVDASTGELDAIATMNGFFENDRRMADIAFSPEGRLFGVTSNRLYEIHPVTGQLTNLGLHEVPNANAMVFERDGSLLVMGRHAPDLFEVTFDDTRVLQTRVQATLSELGDGVGANGDIAKQGNDLVVASSDNRLIFYRFDINPDRPRFLDQVELDSLGVNDVLGLAVDPHEQLVATTASAVVKFDLSNPATPTIESVTVDNDTFGDLRGAGHYTEAGGPVPIGTIAGTKWHDVNGDGVRQATEGVLAQWPVYLDTNVNGTFDQGEPSQLTDDHGRYHFFGLEPGLYTVDELISDPTEWEQTFPRSAHRHLAGVYSFDSITASNQLFHQFGLPDMTSSLVNLQGAGSAVMIDARSFLELPTSLGEGPFSIAVDATYSPSPANDNLILSQRSGSDNQDRDYQLLAQADLAVGQFCNGAGDCIDVPSGDVLGTRSSYGLTWDGERVGAFADEVLVTEPLTGTRPDVDGSTVRFGNPTAATSPKALQGSIHEIRIYNAALTEAELIDAFAAPLQPTAYTVMVDDTRGVDGMDFGNREPDIVEMVPEIEVRRGGETGEIIENNATIMLDPAAKVEDPPVVQLFVHNKGTQVLNLPAVDVTDGFEISGDLVSIVQPGEFTSMFVTLTDRTPGEKSGTLTIQNNDADENPFIINLTTELIDLNTGPRDLLMTTTAGRLLRMDRVTGAVETLMSNLPSLTDIAHHPTEDRLLGIDATRIYEISVIEGSATPLFNHGIQDASALAFSPTGQLFAASDQVYRIDVSAHTATPFASGGETAAGDLAFVGTRLFLSTVGGNLYEVRDGQAQLVGDSGNLTLTGLASIDADSLFGFSSNQTFEVDTEDAEVTPQFSRFVFSITGATFQPEIDAHNERNPFDVNDDGVVAPLDALLVINEMNSPVFTDPETQRLIARPVGETKYPDVNDDGFVSPIDALLVINFLNENAMAARTAAGAALPAESPAADKIGTTAVDAAFDLNLLPALGLDEWD